MRHFKLIALLAFAALAAGAAAGAQTTSPPAEAASPAPYATGVSIDVYLTAPVNTQTAQVADSFSFQTKSDVPLGSLDVPAGTPGHGRLAVVAPATNSQSAHLSLQADSIDLPNGQTVWVNIDPSMTPVGHYTNGRNGNIVLDVGTRFRVITISPRHMLAPLLTAPTLPPETPVPTAIPVPSPTP